MEEESYNNQMNEVPTPKSKKSKVILWIIIAILIIGALFITYKILTSDKGDDLEGSPVGEGSSGNENINSENPLGDDEMPPMPPI